MFKVDGPLTMLATVAWLLAQGCTRQPETEVVSSSGAPAETAPQKTNPPPALPSEKKPTYSTINIKLPTGPPRPDPVEPGTYVLSIHLELDTGAEINERHACKLSRNDDKVLIDLDRSAQEPLVGVLKSGRLVIEAREAPGSYRLEGQVTGPGKLAGKVNGEGSQADARIVDGRWSLEKIK